MRQRHHFYSSVGRASRAKGIAWDIEEDTCETQGKYESNHGSHFRRYSPEAFGQATPTAVCGLQYGTVEPVNEALRNALGVTRPEDICAHVHRNAPRTEFIRHISSETYPVAS